MGSARLILLLTKALALRRVAVVTGGTRGIGRGISEALAEHDFDLLVSYNSDAAAAEQAAGELKAKYRCAVECVGGDVSLPETRAKIWETFDKVYGETHTLGAVVHNADQYVGVTSTNAAGIQATVTRGVVGGGAFSISIRRVDGFNGHSPHRGRRRASATARS